MSSARRWLSVAGATIGLGLLGVQGISWRSYANAQRFANFGLWSEARTELDRYLWLHRRDADAHLLYAEAALKDTMLDGSFALPQAISHLAAIPDDARIASIARTKEAQIALVELRQPSFAEAKFRRALELDPKQLPTWYGLWKLLDQTGRSHLAEDVFWHTYELSPDDRKVICLREWFMSQFFPALANPTMDRAMGIIGDRDSASSISEGRRFQAFMQSEPASPIGYVCWARWLELEGVSGAGLQSLYDAADKMEGEEQDPFYLTTVIGILIDLGQNDEAATAFKQWPADKADGYEYWVTLAAVLHEIDGDYQKALEAYDQALQVWPGQADWRTRSKRATCLAAMGDTAGAQAERTRVKELQKFLGSSSHLSLREALGQLDNPDALMQLVDFYKKIDREREASCWEAAVARIRKQQRSGEVDAR